MPTATVTKVVDASALAAVLFREPNAEAVASWLRDTRLVAPALWAFELTNVCLVKIRRHPQDREKLRAMLDVAAEQLSIETVTVDHVGVLELAEATGLTAYDASYLWLARALDCELVTLDKQLAAVAETASR